MDERFSRFAPEHRSALEAFSEGPGRHMQSFVAYAETLAPQPFIQATSHKELPQEILRKCCQFKSCGNTDLYLSVEAFISNKETLETSIVYVYRRHSNDDSFFGSSTLEGIVEQLNDPLYFPVLKD